MKSMDIIALSDDEVQKNIEAVLQEIENFKKENKQFSNKDILECLKKKKKTNGQIFDQVDKLNENGIKWIKKISFKAEKWVYEKEEKEEEKVECYLFCIDGLFFICRCKNMFFNNDVLYCNDAFLINEATLKSTKGYLEEKKDKRNTGNYFSPDGDDTSSEIYRYFRFFSSFSNPSRFILSDNGLIFSDDLGRRNLTLISNGETQSTIIVDEDDKIITKETKQVFQVEMEEKKANNSSCFGLCSCLPCFSK